MSAGADIPARWAATALSDLADFRGGGTPSKSESSYWQADAIPWVSPKDMKTFVIRGSEDRVSVKALDKLSLLPEESVLVVVRSGILSHTLPVAVTSVPVTINQDMRALVPRPGINSRFLAWQLVAWQQRVLDQCSKHGTTVASIEGPAFARFAISVAPTNEQGRIVEKLEELLSDLDAGVAELRAARAKLKVYRQSLLKSAVTGELTAESRKDRIALEGRADVLARLLAERRRYWERKQAHRVSEQGKPLMARWREKYSEPLPLETTRLPNVPDGWVWVSLDQLCPNDIANGRSVPTAGSGPLVLRLNAVRNGRIDLIERKAGEWSEAEARPYFVEHGDLLIVRGNGSLRLVGRAGLVVDPQEEVAYPDTLIRVRLVSSVVSPDWLSLVWDSWFVRKHLEGRARTSAGIYKISQPDILSTPIPLPPLDEQRAILNLVAGLFASADVSEAAFTTAHIQSEAQRKNILRAAFSGQLVPQDPNDEPASALLQRIRAERAARLVSTRSRPSSVVQGAKSSEKGRRGRMAGRPRKAEEPA